MLVLVNELWVPLDIEFRSNYWLMRWCDDSRVYQGVNHFFDDEISLSNFWFGFYSVLPELNEAGSEVFYMPYSRMPSMKSYD